MADYKILVPPPRRNRNLLIAAVVVVVVIVAGAVVVVTRLRTISGNATRSTTGPPRTQPAPPLTIVSTHSGVRRHQRPH